MVNGTLFEDPEFPPDNELLRLRSKRVEDDVEWMRPSEYLELAKNLEEDTPILVSERNEGFDIKVCFCRVLFLFQFTWHIISFHSYSICFYLIVTHIL